MESVPARFARFCELGEDIDNQIQRLEELEASVGSVGQGPAGSVGHGKGEHADRTAYLVVRMEELRERLREMTEQERAERRELDALLYTATPAGFLLSAFERAVVQYRCFDRLSWDQMSDALLRTDRGCRGAFARAMEKLEAHRQSLEA